MATVPVRAVLNLVGVAALLPVLQLVLDDNPTRFSPMAICLGVLAVIVLKNILNKIYQIDDKIHHNFELLKVLLIFVYSLHN